MEKPFEVDYQGFTPTEAQVTLFKQKISAFESKFGRIAAGRIVVRAPSARHHSGGLYEVNIRLRLPAGKEVDISRTPDPDERHANFQFAVNDAFRRAQRQLQKQTDRLEGEVKAHGEQPTGTVTKLFEDHGFLEDSEGLEIYFHKNSVLDGGFAKMTAGTRVVFKEEPGERGPQASTVTLMGKHGLK
jgi:cold shock CspA family protein